MSMNFIITLDLGTTFAKCVIYDESGKVIVETKKEMKTYYPKPGLTEIPVEQFYSLSCANIKECLSKSKLDPKKIAVISIDSLMGGIIGVDRNFDPVTYYDNCLDTRASDIQNFITNNYGEPIIEKNGSCSVWGHKILYWKKKNEWKDIKKFVQPVAFVAARLSGLSIKDAFIDPSFLSFSALSDLEKSEWSTELLRKFKIDISKLPKIIKSTDIVGYTAKKISYNTGLPPGIPICAGCGDVVAGYVGAGVLNTGEAADISGTANILAVNLEDLVIHKDFANMKSPINNSYYLLVSHVIGGRTLKWFTDEFYTDLREIIEKDGGNIYDYLNKEAEKIRPGSHGLISINDLQGRFFPPNMNMRGLFIGHTWSHKKICFYRSILEAIAYDFYLGIFTLQKLVPNFKIGEINAIGSGANSKIWLQIKADVLQLPFKTLYRSDLSTLGTAAIGAYSVGLIKDINSFIDSVLKTKLIVNPKKGEDKKYLKYIEAYKELLYLLKDVYDKIS